MRFVWVGLGGAVGSVARYAIGLRVDQSHFPWATLGINLSGAFILGLFLTLGRGHLSVAVTTPIAVGVLGGVAQGPQRPSTPCRASRGRSH
jgi:CrcB protein